MPKATFLGGRLIHLDKKLYYIKLRYIAVAAGVDGGSEMREFLIGFQCLPDISDTKEAVYTDEAVMGRATPMKTYSHSGPRVITIGMHLYTVTEDDIYYNLQLLRVLQSCVYPQDRDDRNEEGKHTGITFPYVPPIIGQLKIASLLGELPLCAVLRNYNVKYDPTVAWDETTGIPYKFDIDTTWEAVYNSTNLPNSWRIMGSGN